jgi:hypothetical protein
MISLGESAPLGSSHFLPKPQLAALKSMKAPPLDAEARADMAKKLLADAEAANARAIYAVNDEKAGRPAKRADTIRLAAAPAVERFGSRGASSAAPQTLLAAYAAHSQNPAAASAALSRWLTPGLQDGVTVSESGEAEDLSDAGDADDVDMPDNIPLPQLRPIGAPRQPVPAGARAIARAADPAAGEADRPTAKPELVAFARPENPAQKARGGGLGQVFRDMFSSRPKAGNGVAVYDISAAKVYMPDGSVLEAHSGIGKMADDPRYVHVKMNGPTPPHTYNLRMRERLFHGVEAIRMIPVDGKNKYGRDGFLTHSYLLRGRPEESHGCVAFKDYDRFLKAFKQGKVRQMIVVPGGGAATMRLVSNGRGV